MVIHNENDSSCAVPIRYQGDVRENVVKGIPRNGVQRPSVTVNTATAIDWVIRGWRAISSLVNVQSGQHKSVNSGYECCFM